MSDKIIKLEPHLDPEVEFDKFVKEFSEKLYKIERLHRRRRILTVIFALSAICALTCGFSAIFMLLFGGV